MGRGQCSPIPVADRLTNHWYSRAGWEPGRLFDTWHLVFDDSPQVRELAGRCRNAVRQLRGLDQVPDIWLHMTIQGVGWSDELSQDDVRTVIRHAQNELVGLGSREIQLGPPVVKGEALVLAATPTDYLNELRNRLRVAIGKSLGKHPWTAAEQAKGFVPHVSIAYARVDANAAPYVVALNSVSPATTRAPIRHVALIRQERQLEPHWRYVWTELARVPLAAGPV
jgi:2'-5' RNA ligase